MRTFIVHTAVLPGSTTVSASRFIVDAQGVCFYRGSDPDVVAFFSHPFGVELVGPAEETQP